ncbi:SH3 domain-containing protein [Microbacterium sp. NIBRBAC000506063]|uniref:SH3 domain-containing protein n=1 Tax=Microbacterium sp. NIBRBAC000506063 TaxID=2734618 RepID=UPI001BB75E1D|nr:SH3 domain-containing protein [Microbacterium sp. NIBRBAC000506063]QTV79658.1 SH3 domain-containing protein [Microbacterium sp. NIBRBAC000506063]
MLTAAFVAVGLLALTGPAPQAQASDLPRSIAEGGFIISDSEFFKGNSMTEAQIQTFLNQRVPTCASGATCLKNYKETFQSRAADQYCKALTGGTNLTAARIIHRVANACGINPKVLLVMLQKEQSLVTLTNPSQLRFDRAMGFACPDSGPNNSANCNVAHYGFANQVYRGARQMQVYTKNPNSFNYKAGQVNTIKWHPSNACGTSRVFIQNQATANLYIYTPYRANVAALAAGWGTGDACSAYGNRNFYNYYAQWFAPGASSSTGAPAQIAACTQPLSADVAARSVTATVTATTLNVRRAPTTLCSQNVTSLSKGQQVTVTGQYGAWSRATLGGNTVWLSTEHLQMSSNPAPAGTSNACAVPSSASVTAAGGLYLVDTGSLNGRRAPSTACTTGVVSLSSGTELIRVATYGIWWKVERGGSTYWVDSRYLTPAPTDVTSGAVNLRSGPSSSHSVITLLPKGTAISVAEVSGSWRKVVAGSRVGWIHKDYISGPGLPPSQVCAVPSASEQTAASGTYLVNVNTLNGRAAPTTDCATDIVKLPWNTALERVATYGTWTLVTNGSETYWVSSSLLRAAPTDVTTGAVNLRSSGSMDGTVITLLPKGTTVAVLAASGSWRNVTSGPLEGWVHRDYITGRPFPRRAPSRPRRCRVRRPARST